MGIDINMIRHSHYCAYPAAGYHHLHIDAAGGLIPARDVYAVLDTPGPNKVLGVPGQYLRHGDYGD